MNLLRAELSKIRGNLAVTGCLLGIFPVFAGVFSCLAALVLILSESARADTNNVVWTELMIATWNVINNPLGRILILAFTAVQFGGEYQWNTWKNVVPRSRRVPLIMAKFLSVSVAVIIAMTLTSFVAMLGGLLWASIAGVDVIPSINGNTLSEFLQDYSLQATTAFSGTLIAAGFSAIAAVFTRSILGSVIVGFIFSIVDIGIIIALGIVSAFLDDETLLHIVRITPNYNLLNISSWVNNTMGTGLTINGEFFEDSAIFSIIIILAWILALVGSAIALFRSQDIVN